MRIRTAPLWPLIFLLAGPAAGAEAVTFTADVLPILRQHCQECHRPAGANVMGMVAPMALRTYDEVRPWARSIARQVKNRTMPPWHAAPEHRGVFANERSLSEAEIATIVSWVAAGAPKGADAAPRAGSQGSAEPSFAAIDGWTLGTPDLVVPFDEAFFVRDEVEDLYQTITVKLTAEQLPEERFIRAMEFQPGSQAVHHIVIFTDDHRESLGFPMGMLGGMGPGTDATVFPDGYGRRLSAEVGIIFNMHYHKEPGPGTGVWDHSRIGFQFHDGPVEHEVHWGAIGTQAFRIPPYAANHEVIAEHLFTRPVTLLALFPHTHLRGKASKYIAFLPDGSEEVLLDVPRYDFNWQTNYIYRQPKTLPAGTRLRVHMWYDNSEARAELAGIDPSRTVGWGQPTTDEMMYGWIDYTYADERSGSSGQ